MTSLEQNLKNLYDPNSNSIMIASHRGKFASSVMENTSLAFLIAMRQGADMVEMDLEKTKDGQIIGHHDNTLERLFHDPSVPMDKTLEALKTMPIYNCFAEPCAEKIETFDEILKILKNQTILILDKCWDCWNEVYALLQKQDMLEQAVFKFYIEDEQAMNWAKSHVDCSFIPMLGDMAYMNRVIELKSVTRVPALEILPLNDHDEVFQSKTLKMLHEYGMKVWCNSLSLSENLSYGAGYDDLKSLRYGGDAGWGKLISQGVDIIQTDWPLELHQYLLQIMRHV